MDSLIEDLLPLFFILTFLLGAAGGAYLSDDYVEVEKLSNAICDEMYDMDFSKFDDDKLYCKAKDVEPPKPISRKFDGLEVVKGDTK